MHIKYNKLKKIMQKILEPILTEKDFSYSEARSAPSSGLFIYSIEIDDIKFDSIEIRVTVWEPAITVDLHSHKRGGLMGLDFLHNNKRKAWSIASEDRAKESFQEIKELIEQYAWDWFYID